MYDTSPFPHSYRVLFPGGGVSLNSSGYAHIGSVVLQLAMKVC